MHIVQLRFLSCFDNFLKIFTKLYLHLCVCRSCFYRPICIELYHFKIAEVQFLCTMYDWQPPLIFVRFTSNFLCMWSTIGAHAQEVWGKSDKDYEGLSLVQKCGPIEFLAWFAFRNYSKQFLKVLKQNLLIWMIIFFSHMFYMLDTSLH